ncbi:MAG TPA: phytochelatin synthase family protein [Oculatellaceae cyanobacterium]
MNTSKHRISIFKVIRLPLQAAIIGLSLASGGLLAQTLQLPQNLINLNSTEGEKLLMESKALQDYFPLSIQFVTQKNQAYCGVASSIMVLNAIAIPAPEAPEYAPYHLFTQDNFFNTQTQKVVTPDVVSRRGMTLAQLGKLLESYPVKAEVHHAGELTLDEFRTLVVKNLQEPKNFVLVNYLRKAIGQETGGHISPLAAYNEKTDRFLILDVSRYKYPPVWVKAEELWKAMATVDSDSGKTRGFVLVSPRQ